MKHKKQIVGNSFKIVLAGIICIFMLTGCGGSGGKYSTYASAYNKVTASGGMDADLNVTLTMDGQTSNYTGNFKVDTANNIMYYEMGSGDTKTIQFSDGSYVYTEHNGEKVKYALNSEGSGPAEPQKEAGAEAPAFNTSEFLQDFSSFLEAGSIREMGLLDPIPESAVTKTSASGDVYTLTVADSVVEHFLNTMAKTQSGDGDTVQVSNLENFNYTATVQKDVVTGTTYAGTMTVVVPASLMSSGEEASYNLDFNIAVTFNNPGSAVTVTLPDTAEYQEVSNLDSMNP